MRGKAKASSRSRGERRGGTADQEQKRENEDTESKATRKQVQAGVNVHVQSITVSTLTCWLLAFILTRRKHRVVAFKGRTKTTQALVTIRKCHSRPNRGSGQWARSQYFYGNLRSESTLTFRDWFFSQVSPFRRVKAFSSERLHDAAACSITSSSS